MAKTAVKFLRGWSRYNTGDVAAFESDQAKALTDAGIAALAPPKAPKQTVIGTLAVDVDLRETPAFKDVQDEIRRTVARLADQEAVLEAREAELAGREAELNAREDEVLALAKAMDAAGDQLDASQSDEDGADDAPALALAPADADPAKASKGGLPKQGR